MDAPASPADLPSQHLESLASSSSPLPSAIRASKSVPVAASAAPSAAAGGGSLDTLQTSVGNNCPLPRIYPDEWLSWQPNDDYSQAFVHSGWSVNRVRVQQGMLRCGETPDRVMRFMECGTKTWVYENIYNAHEFRTVSNHCGDRLCVVCARLRSQRVKNALVEHLEDKRSLKFITLTLCDTKDGLRPSLKRLYRHFRALREHMIWKDNVRGGVAFCEAKYSEKADRWHPHLHLIVDANFIPQAELSRVWHGITGDAYIVHVKPCSSGAAAAAYAGKYASKPTLGSFVGSRDLLDEAIIAVKGVRLFFCFGDWYGTSLSALCESEGLFDDAVDPQWHSHGDLRSLHARAGEGDQAASFILSRLEAANELRNRLNSS